MHKGSIRHDGFVQPLGYMLGMTLAQQYGFASELLDFTSDLRVAAFFAVHDGPHYLFEGNQIARRTGHDNGLIYRLPSTKGKIKFKRLDDFDYYTCPEQIHMTDLCMRFEDRSSPEMQEQAIEQLAPEEIGAALNGRISLKWSAAREVGNEIKQQKPNPIQAYKKYLNSYFLWQIRYYRLLDLPPGSFDRSRMGRQRAVAIIPDELRITVHPTDEQDYASFQAVEDVSKREGCQAFYFRHSGVHPDNGEINNEFLWPKEGDIFREWISIVLDPLEDIYTFANRDIQKRLDLVSTGFADL
jgi:hypothetical protein